MISFDALPGNRSLKASLRRVLAGRIPQTVLLSGDDTRGLETLSTVLAAGILCETDGPRPCGACLSCRKVQDGVHPDLTLIDEGEDELKVDLARRIKAENAIIPNDGARRVTIIRHAHNMNAAAQNALLKELEEPPHFAFFVLTSEKPDALLQTVRSRCTRFALEPPEEAAVSDDEATRILAPYLTAVAGKREGSMMLAALGMEKTPRRALIGVMGVMQAALRDAIFLAKGLREPPLQPGLSKQAAPARILRLHGRAGRAHFAQRGLRRRDLCADERCIPHLLPVTALPRRALPCFTDTGGQTFDDHNRSSFQNERKNVLF